MNSAKKLFSGKNMEGIFFLLVLVVAGIALVAYSNNKGNYPEAVLNGGNGLSATDGSSGSGNVKANDDLATNYGPISGVSGPAIPSCASTNAINNPGDLLPKQSNDPYSSTQQTNDGTLSNVNLLKAGYHIGIDTVGQSLRNANLQLRSEPPNPRTPVGPWMNSTIEGDPFRKAFEIGCGCI